LRATGNPALSSPEGSNTGIRSPSCIQRLQELMDGFTLLIVMNQGLGQALGNFARQI
jgi:thiazole synthase ThiGH ThiG subunit